MATQLQRFRGSGARQGRGLLAFAPNMDAFHVPIVTPPGAEVTLPTWPTSYTGTTYYVSASGGSTSLSNNSRSNPATADTAIGNAPSLSTIVFLGAGPYQSSLTVNRPENIHLKLIADVPVFTDLVNLHPTSLTLAQMDALEDTVVVGMNLTTSARLRALHIQAGGNIWVEGFRCANPDNWDAANGDVARVWFEKCHWNQGTGDNLQIGPNDGSSVNQLNVVHKCWCKSYNELGDDGWPPGGGGNVNTAGTAVTDYGIVAYHRTGSVQVLECFIQMRANHQIATKRNVGQNSPSVKNRIEGNLFASWSRSYQNGNTTMQIGQEQDTTNDQTCRATDIINNTICDPITLVFSLQNSETVRVIGNRVLKHSKLLTTLIAGSASSPAGTNTGPIDPGDFEFRDNIIIETSGTCELYSVGVAATITFENNTSPNLIALHRRTDHVTYGTGWNGSLPAITVTRVNGDACGFAAPTLN